MAAATPTRTDAALAGACFLLAASLCAAGCSKTARANSEMLQERYQDTHRAALGIRNALTTGTSLLELRQLVLDLTTSLDQSTLRAPATAEEEQLRALYREVAQLVVDALHIAEATAGERLVEIRVEDGIRSWENNVKTYYYKIDPNLAPELKEIVDRYGISGNYLHPSDREPLYLKAAQAVDRAHSLLATR